MSKSWRFDPFIGDILDENGKQVAATIPENRKVNGPLLAAAPELLEALKAAGSKLFALGQEFGSAGFANRHDDGPQILALAEQAWKAIAKAESRS